MRLFAIGDLHMPGGDDKPMDVFGAHWTDHVARIFDNWRQRVSPEDVVLIPGDVTWAMQLQAAVPDLQAIGSLPGRKLLCKGNHDYWWSSLTKIKQVLPEGMEVLQHTVTDIGPAVVTGTRGWSFPVEGECAGDEDERILQRELIRLELGLKAACQAAAGRPVVVMLHYPPLYDNIRDTPFTRLLAAYPVHTVVYGHLHGAAIHAGFRGMHEGIRYMLVSSDSPGFAPAEFPLGEDVAQIAQNE